CRVRLGRHLSRCPHAALSAIWILAWVTAATVVEALGAGGSADAATLLNGTHDIDAKTPGLFGQAWLTRGRTGSFVGVGAPALAIVGGIQHVRVAGVLHG